MKEYVGIRQATRGGYLPCEINGVADFLYPTSKHRRGRVQGNGQICPTITAENTGVCKVEKNDLTNEILDTKDTQEETVDWSKTEYRIRKLTARECYRLMDVQEDAADKMLSINSQTQCYKQAGNSIVVSVLCAVFSQLNLQGVKPWNERTLNEKYDLVANPKARMRLETK